MKAFHRTLCALVVAALSACGSNENEANRRGVGAECTMPSDCTEEGQACLTAFKGGYCGVSDCAHDSDCPAGSACVTGDDQVNYCFLVCVDKIDCNAHRSVDNESSCTSSLTFIDGTMGRKVCRPPNSGV
jgi:hypothetical protein